MFPISLNGWEADFAILPKEVESLNSCQFMISSTSSNFLPERNTQLSRIFNHWINHIFILFYQAECIIDVFDFACYLEEL